MRRRLELKQLRIFCCGIVFVFALCIPGGVLQATYVYPFEIFTSNGGYYDSGDLDTYMVVSNGVGEVNFTFYNESLIQSSIEGIYFDDGSLLGIASIENGPGTSFSQYAKPGNLPGGNLLDPNFVAEREFSVDSDPPVASDGINPPDEWLKITFNLINGGTLEDVVQELNTGVLRVGIHIIDLPDGSSESAIAVPEPASILLLGLGGLALLKKRRKYTKGLV